MRMEQARTAIPATKLAVDDIVDDSIVGEIEKDGFIDRLFRREEP